VLTGEFKESRIARQRRPKALMLKFARLIALAATAGGICAASPASAQFGGIFREGPPRPPSDIPVYRDERLPPPMQRDFPGRDAPQPPPPPLTRFPTQPGERPGGIQTEQLPPPPGTAPQQATLPPPGAPPPSAPGQRPPRGTPEAAPSTPAAPLPPPSGEVVVAPPAQKIVNPTAAFAGLDKITGRIISFDVSMDETVQFGALRLTPRACYTRPPTELPHTDGFVEVDEITLQGEVKRIFTGWMFAASPGLHGIEHPIYDVWLTNCKKEAVVAGAAAPQPAAQPAQPAQAQPSTPAAPAPQAQPSTPAGSAPLRR
jgi:hypothetical protein